MFYLILILILILLYVLYKNYQQKKNLQELIQQLDRLNLGDYSYNLNIYKEGDLSILYAQLHKVITTLKSQDHYIKKQNKFLKKSLEDMTHQLKTPLSNLKLLNELDIDSPYTEKNQRQLERLEALMNSLVLLIRLDNNLIQYNIKKIPMDSLLNLIREHFPDLVVDNSVEEISVDIKYMFEALYNILENKLRYKKSKIYWDSYSLGNNYHIEISDDGEKISDIERSKVLERFYSGLGKKEDSIGIGLSLSKEFIEGQQGKLWIEKDNTFHIQFPK